MLRGFAQLAYVHGHGWRVFGSPIRSAGSILSQGPLLQMQVAAAGRRPVIIDQCMRSIELHAAAAAVNFGSGRRASWPLMLAAIETEKVWAGNP